MARLKTQICSITCGIHQIFCQLRSRESICMGHRRAICRNKLETTIFNDCLVFSSFNLKLFSKAGDDNRSY